MADLRNTLIRPAAWAFYVVLVFEILFMISPAALFFYSASVRLPRLLPTGGVSRVVAGPVLFAVVMVAAVTAGFGVREYSVSRLSAIWHPDTAIVALAPMSRDELTAANELAAAAPGVRSRLDTAAGSSLVY